MSRNRDEQDAARADTAFVRPLSRRHFLQGAAGAAAAAALPSLLRLEPEAYAASGIACPNANPIVNENRCTAEGTWTEGFQLGTGRFSGSVAGWATATSVDKGETLGIRLVTFGTVATADLRVYRLGYYGSRGGRLVAQALGAQVNQNPASATDVFGRVHYPDASVPLETILGTGATAGATAISGVYLVKVAWTEAGQPKENQIIYVVRDDARKRDLLVAMPSNTWQAYNNYGGKSLYYYNSSVAPTIFDQSSGADLARSKALKVSFNRPYVNGYTDYNWVLRTEFPLIYWLERMGYDLAYTEDIAVHRDGSQLLRGKTTAYVIAGHSEYWTREMFDHVEAARDSATGIVSFSANTAYWQVRLEDGERTLVCFKTIENQGSLPVTNGQTPDASTGVGYGVNDFGPQDISSGQRKSSVDPLGPTGAHTPGSATRPEHATTTFRDSGELAGASAGTTNDTAANRDGAGHGAGRVGPARPESNLFGLLYIGDDDAVSYGLTVPPGAGSGGEFGAHAAWRHTDVTTAGATVGTNFVGWEWDAIPEASCPVYAPAAGTLPVPASAIKRLTSTLPSGGGRSYLQDLGRQRASTPPAGLSGTTQAATWIHPSGARMFVSGTMQWSWGLGPHFLDRFDSTYEAPRTDSSQLRMQQCTYNILVDMGLVPATPTEDIVKDPDPPAPPPPEPPPTPPTPPTPPEPIPRIAISKASVRLTPGGYARIKVHCPADQKLGVEAKLTLETAGKVRTNPKSRRTRKVRFGVRTLQILGDRTVSVDLLLSKANRDLLARLKKVKVTVTVQATNKSGKKGTIAQTIYLYPAAKTRAGAAVRPPNATPPASGPPPVAPPASGPPPPG